MTRLDALQALLEKVGTGEFPGDLTGPEMGFPDTSAVILYDIFSGDVNAFLKLMAAVLPGWKLSMIIDHKTHLNMRHGDMIVSALADNPARAGLIAVIRTQIAEEEDDG
jgi:hypothetical protein